MPSFRANTALFTTLLLTAAAAPAAAGDCAPPHTLARAEACALVRSPELEEARQAVAAAEGKRLTASALLASPPELRLSGSRRFLDDGSDSTWNWSVVLDQQLEVAGQRGARLAEAEAALSAAQRRLAWAFQQERAQVARAWLQLVASRELLRIQERALVFADRLLESTEQRAREELVSMLEADLVRASTAEVAIKRDDAEARLLRATAALHRLLGVDPQVPEDARVALGPQPGSGPADPDQRADVQAAALQERAARAAGSLQRRARIPSPLVGGFVEDDGFAEKVVGLTVSVPLFLPSEVAANGAGELQSALADQARATAQFQGARDQARFEVEAATVAWQGRRRTLSRFDPKLLAREAAHLGSLEEAAREGTVSPREAARAQRAIVEWESSAVEAQLNETLARIELLLARGELAETNQ